MSFSAEAEALGCERIAESVLEDLAGKAPAEVIAWVTSLPKWQSYFLKYWSEGNDVALPDLAQNWKSHEQVWDTRLRNHGYVSLFWLSKGRKGARIRKYYAG